MRLSHKRPVKGGARDKSTPDPELDEDESEDEEPELEPDEAAATNESNRGERPDDPAGAKLSCLEVVQGTPI